MMKRVPITLMEELPPPSATAMDEALPIIHPEAGPKRIGLRTPGSVLWAWMRGKQEHHYTADIEVPGDWTDLWHIRNTAIATCYLSIGFSQNFLSTPLSVYMVKELNAHPAVQNTIGIVLSLPWCTKILHGFLSDTFSIGGERRRPYIFLGFLLYSTSYLLLSCFERPSSCTLAIFLFTATLGGVMADTVADSMVVERSRHEELHDHGQLQSSCYAVRFAGGVVGAILGTLLYNRQHWGWGLSFHQVTTVLGAIPVFVIFPLLPFLREISDAPPKPVDQQVQDIWAMVQKKAVWRPMAFVYLFNCMQVPNVAWSSYVQLALGFNAWNIGLIGVAGSIMTFLGVVAYKKYFSRMSWRAIYVMCASFSFVFSVMQLLLIFQINTKYLHISNYLFAFGDDVISAYLAGIQFLPVCFMYLRLCPDGSEGASYAMLTTLGNIALACGSNIGSLLSHVWDVSNETLAQQDYYGLWRLTLLTSCLSPIPLVLLFLLPANPEEQAQLQASKRTSAVAGAIFLTVLFSSIAWTFAQAIHILITQPA